jgi:hypothetical protein
MLETLSVCCYYSDSTASLVVGGMRLLARSQNEAPFACLSRALVQQDIEVKAAVMQVRFPVIDILGFLFILIYVLNFVDLILFTLCSL